MRGQVVNFMPIGPRSIPDIHRLDFVSDEIEFVDGSTAHITTYLDDTGHQTHNPAFAYAVVAGPWRGKWLTLKLPQDE